MQVSVTFNFNAIREDNLYLSNKYKNTWVDPNNPTDAEIAKSIKDETLEKLEIDTRVSTFEVTD
tara:strand:+ start:77 stop:268 length:192 start_codon:yes stop_codon:yes gene_type:complete